MSMEDVVRTVVRSELAAQAPTLPKLATVASVSPLTVQDAADLAAGTVSPVAFAADGVAYTPGDRVMIATLGGSGKRGRQLTIVDKLTKTPRLPQGVALTANTTVPTSPTPVLAVPVGAGSWAVFATVDAEWGSSAATVIVDVTVNSAPLASQCPATQPGGSRLPISGAWVAQGVPPGSSIAVRAWQVGANDAILHGIHTRLNVIPI